MFNRVLGLSTAIIMAGCMFESNTYPSVAANINNNISKSHSGYQIAQATTYQVGLGDTLGGIANKFGLSLSQILTYNPKLRSRPNLIYLGETINVREVSTNPAKVSRTSAPKYTYTVKSGDTLGGIAIRHGLSLDAILASNPQLASRRNNIDVGEKINLGFAPITLQRRLAPIKPVSDTSITNQTTTNTSSPTPAPSRGSFTFKDLPSTRRQGSDNTGSKRGTDTACTKAGENMRAIAPDNGLGFTFDDYPYFFWYFPGLESDSVPIIFTLLSQETREVNGKTRMRSVKVYEKELNLERSGIIAFPLPAESEPLQEEKEYKWRIQINCTPTTRMFLKYSIKRQSTDNPELISKLEAAPVDRHPAIFAESGIWFDALKMITLQLEQAPEDPVLTEDWNKVLTQIGFEDLIGQPIQYIEPNIEF